LFEALQKSPAERKLGIGQVDDLFDEWPLTFLEERLDCSGRYPAPAVTKTFQVILAVNLSHGHAVRVQNLFRQDPFAKGVAFPQDNALASSKRLP
jgi:hypothetical protein